jgi:hypothetical protein
MTTRAPVKPKRRTPARRPSGYERFMAQSEAARQREVAEFDKEFIGIPGKPLTPQMRADWAKAKRKRGRPTVGQGSQTISVTVERGLLSRADSYAKERGISRSQLIAKGLAAVLSNVA